MNTRELVLESARRMFAERGYRQVTIRQIATECGVSPAMVMKVGGSKEKLYADATPPELEPLSPDWPTNQIGREMVRRILLRRDADAADPWLQSLLSTLDAPNPGEAREEFRRYYVDKFAERMGDGGDRVMRAELVAALLVGLASAARAFRLLADREQSAEIIERYGAIVQGCFDGGVIGPR